MRRPYHLAAYKTAFKYSIFQLTLVSWAAVSSAQSTEAASDTSDTTDSRGAKGAAVVKESKEHGGGKEQGYGYEFSDDPLSAGGFGPNDATIRVRPGPVRTTLIRPRTSFVQEMLKSVENL